MNRWLFAGCFAVAALGSGCSSSDDGAAKKSGTPTGCAAPQAAYDPPIVPADFSTQIDNPLSPLVPGTTFVWKDADANVTTITVTSETKLVAGVECVLVRDTAKTASGETIEDTFDWFAQDSSGNVWYFGEDTTAYSGSKTSKLGSWETGVDCAKPGIIMEASPKVGDTYRQEYLAGAAEDQAKVEAVGESVTVPAGSYTGCVKTRDYSELAPGQDEYKWYCPGVGNVAAEDIADGNREELQSKSP